MPRSGNFLFPLVNLILLPFGLFALGFGLLGLFADPEARVIFAVVVLAGVLILVGMVQGLVRWRRAYRREEEEAAALAAVARARAADPTARLPRTVLAHWTYPWSTATPAGDVVISPTAILMNDHYQVIQDHHFRFRSAHVVDDVRPKLLVIGIEWPTRYGMMRDDYRIPIPDCREDQARKVASALARQHVKPM
jgi:hypothetical protein